MRKGTKPPCSSGAEFCTCAKWVKALGRIFSTGCQTEILESREHIKALVGYRLDLYTRVNRCNINIKGV